jgi:hypothetical protein
MQAKLYFSLLAFIFQGFTGPVFADQDLAKTSQNPVGNIISHHLRTIYILMPVLQIKLLMPCL